MWLCYNMIYAPFMIKAVLMNPDVYCWAYSHPAESAVLVQLGECCSVICQQLLPVCVCVPAVKVWDVKWLTTVGSCLGTCVWTGGPAGARGVVRLRNSGEGSVARRRRVSVWCVSIWLSNSLSVLLDLSRTNTHIHTGKLAVFFLKSVTELNLWGLPLSLSHFGLSLSHAKMLLSQPSHTVSNFCTSEG